jgi:hypothetical protein
LIVNGLAKRKALPIAVFLQPHRSILWLNEQKRLSSSLNVKPMVTHFYKCGWQASKADESSPSGLLSGQEANRGSCRVETSQIHFEDSHLRAVVANQAALCTLPVYETHLGFKYIGESRDEDKTVPRCETSAGFSFKSHYSKKNGIVAGLFAAQAAAPSGAKLVLNGFLWNGSKQAAPIVSWFFTGQGQRKHLEVGREQGH